MKTTRMSRRRSASRPSWAISPLRSGSLRAITISTPARLSGHSTNHKHGDEMTTSARLESATGSAARGFVVPVKPFRRLAILWAALFIVTLASAQNPTYPLKPADLSSPRATLKTFLDAGDTVGAYMAQDYLPSPSRAKFDHLYSLAATVIKCLDLSEMPPAARLKGGPSAASALYDTLSRIQLPPFDQIPDAAQLSKLSGAAAERWVIPNTEIVIERMKSGPRSGEFLFSAGTVARAEEFYERVRDLPYTRPVPLEHFREITINQGGWMIPFAWIKALPPWLRAPIAEQALWKWIAFFLLLVCACSCYGRYLACLDGAATSGRSVRRCCACRCRFFFCWPRPLSPTSLSRKST